MTVSPGKGGLGTYSPPLDEQGNSVRGRLLTTQIAEALGLHIFASDVHPEVGSATDRVDGSGAPFANSFAKALEHEDREQERGDQRCAPHDEGGHHPGADPVDGDVVGDDGGDDERSERGYQRGVLLAQGVVLC